MLLIILALQTNLKNKGQFTWVCFVALTWIQNFQHTFYNRTTIFFSWQFYIPIGNIIFNKILHLLSKKIEKPKQLQKSYHNIFLSVVSAT